MTYKSVSQSHGKVFQTFSRHPTGGGKESEQNLEEGTGDGPSPYSSFSYRPVTHSFLSKLGHSKEEESKEGRDPLLSVCLCLCGRGRWAMAVYEIPYLNKVTEF